MIGGNLQPFRASTGSAVTRPHMRVLVAAASERASMRFIELLAAELHPVSTEHRR
jgi:hypothetical protein